MPTCPLCDQWTDKFADSHIVPNAISKELRNGTEPLAVLKVAPQANHWEHVKKNYGGITARIVCETCERVHFQDADNCIVPFLRSLPSSNPKFDLPVMADGLRTFQVRAYPGDPGLVHRFALQTLFRFHLANDDEKVPFKLSDKNAGELKNLILSPIPTTKSPWYVSVHYYRTELAATILSPTTRQNSPAIYSYMVPQTEFLIAETFDTMPDGLRQMGITENSDILVFHRRNLGDSQHRLIHSWVDPHIDKLGQVLGR